MSPLIEALNVSPCFRWMEREGKREREKEREREREREREMAAQSLVQHTNEPTFFFLLSIVVLLGYATMQSNTCKILFALESIRL